MTQYHLLLCWDAGRCVGMVTRLRAVSEGAPAMETPANGGEGYEGNQRPLPDDCQLGAGPTAAVKRSRRTETRWPQCLGGPRPCQCAQVLAPQPRRPMCSTPIGMGVVTGSLANVHAWHDACLQGGGATCHGPVPRRNGAATRAQCCSDLSLRAVGCGAAAGQGGRAVRGGSTACRAFRASACAQSRSAGTHACRVGWRGRRVGE